jgi:triosephosphate isomerase
MHGLLEKQFVKHTGNDIAEDVSILMEESKTRKCKEIFSKPDVDGGLIGGAALKSDDFVAIVNALKLIISNTGKSGN